MPPLDLRSALRKVPYLAGLGEEEISALLARAVPKNLERDEILFETGDPARGLIVVVTGTLKLVRQSESGREQVLTIEEPGSSVAEVPLFDGGPYPATAIALEPSVVAMIPRADFFAILQKHPLIAVKVVENIGRRLRRLVFLVEELSLKEVGQRLAGFLLEAAETHGRKGPGGVVEVDLELSNQEIANRVGTVRELVSRCLGRLRSAGIIAVEERLVRILDREALAREAAGAK